MKLGLTSHGIYVAVSESDICATLYYSKTSKYRNPIQALFEIGNPIVSDYSDINFYIIDSNRNGVFVYK